MKALRGIDGSLCGAILSNRSSTLSATKVCHGGQTRLSRRSQQTPGYNDHSASTLRSDSGKDRCSRTSTWLLSTFLPSSFVRHAHPLSRHQQTRCYGHAAAAATTSRSNSSADFANNGHDALLDVVGGHDLGTVDEHLDLVRDPYMRGYPQPDGPHLTISEKKEDINYPSQDQAIRGDPKIQQITEKLRLALATRLRHPTRVPLKTIEKLYRALPQPRMLNLPASLRHRFIKALGMPHQRNARSMLRYFFIMDEVKNAGLTLRRREWNTALAFASQYVGKTGHTETESALQLWNEMERSGGEKANDVTFNVLFDAAAKSGNFELAEKIYSQMEARGFKFNRYHRVSLIHFFGLKEDADGIRAAYKEMVDAGEMIDTVVLNCLIVSFLRAGDEVAALRVYDYMKGTESSPPPETDSRNQSKMITQVLMMYSKIGRNHPSIMESLRKQTPTSPDLQTYRILITHYAWTAGNLNRVVQYLDEMRWFNIPVHGSIFLSVFKGFAKHGNRGTLGWSAERLRNVLSALLQALDETDSKLYIDTWLVGWALRAFMTCSGRDAVLEVYNELQSRWHLHLSEGRIAHMEEFLHEVLRDDGKKKFRHDDARKRFRPDNVKEGGFSTR